MVALVDGDQAAGHAEAEALDDAFVDIVELDRALHLRPEGAGVDAHHLHADELRAEEPDDIEHRHQERHGDDAADQARRHHLAQRVDRHDLHGGELVGGAHQADLGGERGARTAGEQQRRDDGAELLQEPERRGDAERVLGAEALQQVVALQPQHHADEEAAEHDDDERAGAGVVDLVHHGARLGEHHSRVAQHAHEEDADAADAAQGIADHERGRSLPSPSRSAW